MVHEGVMRRSEDEAGDFIRRGMSRVVIVGWGGAGRNEEWSGTRGGVG